MKKHFKSMILVENELAKFETKVELILSLSKDQKAYIPRSLLQKRTQLRCPVVCRGLIQYLLIILLFVGYSELAKAGENHKLFNREQKVRMADANYYLSIGDYLGAYTIYKELLPIDSLNGDLNLKIGKCLFNLDQKVESSHYFEMARDVGEIEANFYLGRIFHLRSRHDRALDAYLKYNTQVGEDRQISEAEVNKMIDQVLFAKEQIERGPIAEIFNVEEINTEYPEYVPLISSDENMLIYTARKPGSVGDQKDPYGMYFEDVYASTKGENGKWESIKGFGFNFNSETHDACVALSGDGEVMLLYRTNVENPTSGDIYESILGPSGWSHLKKLSGYVNSEFQETSACLSADGNLMYFSSNRSGGFGGRDLYQSRRLPNGDWGLAINLGPVINSIGDDDAPFLSHDGQTLYFSSNGRKGMGGYDIFKSNLMDEDVWGEVVNIGHPINSEGDDKYLVISGDEKKGYFSSAHLGGFGGQDIYEVRFNGWKDKLLVVKGTLKFEDRSADDGTTISLYTLPEEELHGTYLSKEGTGTFVMLVHPGVLYKMVIEKEGYKTYEKNFEIADSNELVQFLEDIRLEP